MTIDGNPYSSPRNINLKDGILRFNKTQSSNPMSGDSTGYGLYINSSGQLVFWDASTTTTLGSAGSIANYSLNDAYDDGSTITVDNASITLSANISSTALQISQSGSGADITGTSSTWTVTKAGAATFTGIVLGDNELITFGDGSDATIGWNATLLNVAGATDFDDAVTTQSTVTVGTTLTVTGGAGSDAITLTAGDVELSDSSIALTDADNANTLTVTNNTHSTGSATTGGVVEFRSTSLTTGALLNLELTEATLNGGEYIRCYDVSNTEDVFSIKENGAISMLGNTSGTDTVTVTAGDITLVSGHLEMTVGDITLADGSVNITDADSAVSFQVTNNTITTTAAMVDFDSTSISTGALVRMDANTAAHDGEILELISAGDTTSTPTGLSITIPSVTTGAATGIDVVMAGLTTTGFGIKVTMDAITTGDMLYLDNGGGTMTGDGKFINCNDDNTDVFSVAAGGKTTVGGEMIFAGIEDIVAGGTTTALDLTETVHTVGSDVGGDIFTIANGINGQIKYVICEDATGVSTITPATMAGGTSVTFNALGESVIFMYTAGSGWAIIGGNAYTVI